MLKLPIFYTNTVEKGLKQILFYGIKLRFHTASISFFVPILVFNCLNQSIDPHRVPPCFIWVLRCSIYPWSTPLKARISLFPGFRLCWRTKNFVLYGRVFVVAVDFYYNNKGFLMQEFCYWKSPFLQVIELIKTSFRKKFQLKWTNSF